MPDDAPLPDIAWDIRREGRAWGPGEAMARYEPERLTLLALLLENVGVVRAVRLGNPEVWRAAVRDL